MFFFAFSVLVRAYSTLISIAVGVHPDVCLEDNYDVQLLWGTIQQQQEVQLCK
jgi:hypothetical protein